MWGSYPLQVKKCGFRHIAVASFQHMTRSGEEFLKQLRERGEDLQHHFAFVDVLDKPSVGLLKCKEFGIMNVVLELDLMFKGLYHLFSLILYIFNDDWCLPGILIALPRNKKALSFLTMKLNRKVDRKRYSVAECLCLSTLSMIFFQSQ